MKLFDIIEGYGKLTAQELGLINQTPKAKDRFAKCVQCPDFKDDGLCNLCHCLMKAKVLVNGAYCPKGLWL
jgi:recombinational DNA repair protein RecR